jgi:serine protease Do
VVGNPLGNFVLSVSQGIISGVDRQADIEGNIMNLTQVDAAVNPGNSGGGLFDSQGRLIGIVNAKNTGIDVEGMGFAIPIDTVREVLDMMLQRTDLKLEL